MASTLPLGSRSRPPHGAPRSLARVLVLASLGVLSCRDDDDSSATPLPTITLRLTRVSGAGSAWQAVPPPAAIELDCQRSLGVTVAIEVDSAGQTFSLRPLGFCASTARLCGRVRYELRDADERVLASVEAASTTAFIDLSALPDAAIAGATTVGAQLIAANGSPVVLADRSEVSDNRDLSLIAAVDCDAPPAPGGGAGSGGETSEDGGAGGVGGAAGTVGGAGGAPTAGGAPQGGASSAGGEGGVPLPAAEAAAGAAGAIDE